MKKLLFMMTAVALLFAACNKDKEEILTQDAQSSETGLSFTIQQTDLNFKGTNTDLGPQCNDELNMDYVKFVLGGVEYISEIHMIDGEYLTQVVKLDDGTYYLTSFEVYSDNGTPGDMSDDVLVKAAPMPGSEYHDLMLFPLDAEVEILPFYKKQVPVDVLCFEPLFYNEFGFTWFEFNDVRIEYQCVFGDICVDDFELYEESLYAGQANGIQFDIPAIFEVKVFKGQDTEPIRVFSNAAVYGEGECLEVYWPNRLDEEGEVFNFELWVLLPTLNGFDYVLMDTWTFVDGEGASTGQDGVVDFVIGDCQLEDADYNLTYTPDIDVLIIGANGVEYVNDVVTKLTAFGIFTSVDTYDAQYSTPTLAELEEYEAVLVWSNFYYNDKVALGNVLADYSDLGGGVTVMTFSWYGNWQLAGRYMTEAYGSVPFGNYNPYSPGSLGTVHNPTHPIMNGISSFSANNFRSGYSGPVNAGAELIASYDDGMVLAAVHDHGTSRTCDLGFFPPSSDVNSGSWDVNTDGDIFMLNCLLWTAGVTN